MQVTYDFKFCYDDKFFRCVTYVYLSLKKSSRLFSLSITFLIFFLFYATENRSNDNIIITKISFSTTRFCHGIAPNVYHVCSGARILFRRLPRTDGHNVPAQRDKLVSIARLGQTANIIEYENVDGKSAKSTVEQTCNLKFIFKELPSRSTVFRRVNFLLSARGTCSDFLPRAHRSNYGWRKKYLEVDLLFRIVLCRLQYQRRRFVQIRARRRAAGSRHLAQARSC